MAEIRVNGKPVTADPGTLLSSLVGHQVSMPCGGKGRCGKCRVKATGCLSPLTPEEQAVLSEADIQAGIRLACCTRVLGNAAVETEVSRQVSQICTEGTALWEGSAPMFENLGAAVDIGTTTLAAQLYSRAGLIATAAGPNPQASFGADVITRVGSAMAGNGEALAACVREAVAALLETMCRQAGRPTGDIDALVITGNTAMLHLLTGEDPSPLAAAPFQARELFGTSIPAASLNLPCAPGAAAYLPRCMSAFVGADITTALLASGICNTEGPALLVDIGTNGEMALWRSGKLTCCSTAAGPAFEGANLSQGMQGAPGAIDHASVEQGQLRLHTISDAPARGICGSGVADVLACLLELDILDETGLLDDGEDSYPLTDTVSITQGDVRQVQLAKSAIRAGLETLLHQAGLSGEDLSRLAIAGGFGSYLSLPSAARIGLLPEELVEKSQVLGNAALAGAAMILGNRRYKEESTALANQAQTIDLASNPVFMDNYVEYMMF